MLFPKRMKSISPNNLVLKVGPEGIPHPRANVCLENLFPDNYEAYAKRGYKHSSIGKAETTYYEGGTFPFKDNEFDYIICSHILKHIPQNDLHEFISELARVALRGYSEFPNVFYKLINYQDVHLWMIN